MNTHLNAELSHLLLPNEELIWTGQPKRGFALDRSDWFAFLMGLFVLVTYPIALFTVIPESAQFRWWQLAFVLVILLINYGIYFGTQARRRKHTVYGVSNQRILILTKRTGVLDYLPIQTLPAIDYSEGNDGVGTISFYKKNFLNLWGLSRKRTNGLFETQPRNTMPAFEVIPNVRKVYNKIMSVKQK